MEPWYHLIREDFSDISNVAEFARIAVRLLLAAVLGGVLGLERQSSGKSAGLRTHILVALGAALFVIIPSQAGMEPMEMSRVIQGIITGIGFLGAGAILKNDAQEEISGLTTSAGIWLTAAIGVAAGLGRESTAILATILALAVLSLNPGGPRSNSRIKLETKLPSTDDESPQRKTRP